jgi:glycosyltransferase involved in cell wall biosynthesis
MSKTISKYTTKKIEEPIKNRKLWLHMEKAGRDFVDKNYNWKRSINQMIEVYHDILGNKK